MNTKDKSAFRRIFSCIYILFFFVMLACTGTGCRSTSPILLQMPSEKGGAAEFPFKLGVNPIEKDQSSRISDAKFTMMFIYWIDGRMPRRKETDYVHQSVSDHLNDGKMFKTAYIAPFDPTKVDLTMDIHFEEYKCSNAGGGLYASVMAFPFINLLTLLGIPQEIFSTDIKAVCSLKTREGKLVGKYSYTGHDWDAVTIYEMPYGNYLWYDSVFRREFDNMMQSFYGQMRKDKQKITAEASKAL